MTETEIQNILEKQHKFFQTGQTLPVNYRIEQLKKLKDSIIRHEPDLNLALKADLGKSETDVEAHQETDEGEMGSDAIGTVCRQKLPLAFALRNSSHHESVELPGSSDTGTTD